MIKNSILGKLCPVFHLRSAAVASRQNLNHWLVWPGTVPWCDSEEEHTLVGRLDIEEERRAVGEEGGSSVVENYTTSINHFYSTVFLSSSISRFPHLHHVFSLFLSFMAVHLPLLICTPTAPHPDGPPLAFCPLFLFQSLAMCFIEALLVTLTTPLSIHLNFISTVVCLHAFFIDLLFVAYQGFIPCPWHCISEP